MSNYIQYLYALYMASIDGVVMSALKAYKTGMIKSFWVFPFSVLIYGFQPIVFYSGLGFESMTILNVLWDVLSDIIVAAIGIYLFDEKLTTQQCIGLAFCMAGIVLLGMHE
jgi:multidrug transporter EmrE-like cation transporter